MRKIFSVALFLIFINLSYSSEIKWLTFEEGIKKAQKESKLILMDIYAKWCHWCNVIENTTYRDKKVIKLVEKYYIPIRVDAEERPDINKKYNQGGLPSTLILDQNGNILFGAIYVSPKQMKKLLSHFAKLSKEQIKQEAKKFKQISKIRLKRFQKNLKEKNISEEYLHKVYKYIKIRYDYEYGALKGEPKFPEEQLPYFLILYSLMYEDKKAKKLAEKTLYAYSNLIDNVEGGLYRYSVNEYWTEFHYEKLLKDQADISILYFNGYSFFNNKDFLIFANRLLSFAKNKLYNKKTGYFYNSQGADIVDEKGTLLITGEEYFLKNEEGRQILEQAVGYKPRIEKQVYFSTNSLIAKALVYSYIYNNNIKDLQIAQNIIENIKKDGFTEKGVIHSKVNKTYYINTQVYFLEAVLELYQATSSLKYLELAEEIIKIIKTNYYSKNLKIYVDLNDTGINFKNISFIDNIIAINSRLAKATFDLYMYTGKEEYLNISNSITKRLPTKASIDTALSYFLHIYSPTIGRIVGIDKDKSFFIKKSFKVFPYYHLTQFIERDNIELLNQLGYNPSEETSLYLCNAIMCFKRFTKENINNLKKEVLNIYKLLKAN